MTIEEDFFKTFRIEPEYKCTNENAIGLEQECTCGNVSKCKTCEDTDFIYPEITDRILLELICILGTVIKQFKIPPHLNIETLRGHILRNCINCQEGIYTRVRSLFEVEE